MSCNVYHCSYKKSHLTQQHTCGNCNIKGHGRVECGNPDAIKYLKEYKKGYDSNSYIKIKQYPQIDAIKKLLNTGEYTSLPGELGSQIFIRNVYKDRCEFLFMHQDDWGQYGRQTSRVHLYNNFILGYNKT